MADRDEHDLKTLEFHFMEVYVNDIHISRRFTLLESYHMEVISQKVKSIEGYNT